MTGSSALRILQLQSETRRRAAREFAGRPAPLAVFVFLSDDLDPRSFSARKTEAIACELEIPYGSTADALRLLVRRGYLEEGPKENRVKTYRLGVLPDLKRAG